MYSLSNSQPTRSRNLTKESSITRIPERRIPIAARRYAWLRTIFIISVSEEVATFMEKKARSARPITNNKIDTFFVDMRFLLPDTSIIIYFISHLNPYS